MPSLKKVIVKVFSSSLYQVTELPVAIVNSNGSKPVSPKILTSLPVGATASSSGTATSTSVPVSGWGLGSGVTTGASG